MTATTAHSVAPSVLTGRATLVARAVGAVFLLVGILGFVPGVTSDFGDLAFAGDGSDAHLLGIFQVSVLHNVVHLLFGVLGLLAGRSAKLATAFLLGGGFVYVILAVFGSAIDPTTAVNFVPLNTADDVLHMSLGALMILAGVVTAERRTGRTV